jgi:hypothetical protein
MLMRQLLVFRMCFFSFITGALILPASASSAEAQHTLRDVFFSTVDTNESKLVGKVGLMQVAPLGTQQVAMDHVFSSGERFRFLISANRSGYLYILHRSLEGEVTQLWPRPEMANGFRIEAGRTYTLPNNPGVLVFDDSIGNEQFYIAVRSAPKVPDLSHLTGMTIVNSDDPPGTTNNAREIQPENIVVDAPPGGMSAINDQPDTTVVEWVIRGDPFGEGASRGVVFDPGNKDDDLYRYFSAAPGDADTKAMVQIMLKHN